MPEFDPQAQRTFALEVVERLRARGYTAYWAGGCVRDQLLGRTPKDYDVATNATPLEIREAFGRRRTLEIGAAFGVVGVRGPSPAGLIEVATFRRDASYSDGRHPDAVTFSTPEDDALRRDFTINGLFFDPVAGVVIDYVGGREDLQRGLIRAIGDPRARFGEDKLRMLRAVRFAATFDFALDHDTRLAVREMASDVTLVSAERIAQEMRLLLVHPRRDEGVERLADTLLLQVVAPEVALLDESARRTTCEVLARLETPAFPLALAALLHRVPSAESAAQATAARWRLSVYERERSEWLLTRRAALGAAPSQPWSRLQPLLIAPEVDELLALEAAVAAVEGRDTAHVDYCRRQLARPAEELNPAPLVTGHDLLARGVPADERMGRFLAVVRDAQLDGKVRTLDEALALVDRLLAEGR